MRAIASLVMRLQCGNQQCFKGTRTSCPTVHASTLHARSPQPTPRSCCPRQPLTSTHHDSRRTTLDSHPAASLQSSCVLSATMHRHLLTSNCFSTTAFLPLRNFTRNAIASSSYLSLVAPRSLHHESASNHVQAAEAQQQHKAAAVHSRFYHFNLCARLCCDPASLPVLPSLTRLLFTYRHLFHLNLSHRHSRPPSRRRCHQRRLRRRHANNYP